MHGSCVRACRPYIEYISPARPPWHGPRPPPPPSTPCPRRGCAAAAIAPPPPSARPPRHRDACARSRPPRTRRRCRTPRAAYIEAPWLVNGGHGASLRHHNAQCARYRQPISARYPCDDRRTRWWRPRQGQPPGRQTPWRPAAGIRARPPSGGGRPAGAWGCRPRTHAPASRAAAATACCCQRCQCRPPR
jgi:hypothetical protein